MGKDEYKSNPFEARPEELERVQLEEGEYAPFTYVQCGKLATLFVAQARRANQTGTLTQIQLTEENQTVVTTSGVGEIDLGGIFAYGREVLSSVPLDMENEEHRNVVDAFGAIFLPNEE